MLTAEQQALMALTTYSLIGIPHCRSEEGGK